MAIENILETIENYPNLTTISAIAVVSGAVYGIIKSIGHNIIDAKFANSDPETIRARTEAKEREIEAYRCLLNDPNYQKLITIRESVAREISSEFLTEHDMEAMEDYLDGITGPLPRSPRIYL